jgi:hypothetical protein
MQTIDKQIGQATSQFALLLVVPGQQIKGVHKRCVSNIWQIVED